MAGHWQEMAGLSVDVSEVVYVPSLDAPEDKPHPFVYFITILNEGSEEITFFGRKWIVREESEVFVLEGDGIVGEQPSLGPGERFSYNSYHVLAAKGWAEGAFYGLTESGRRISVPIPRFEMELPGWA
ncbi:ApaG domain [Roseibacillus ishigakijimensis]|uniref:ApaG domain-containing protein n=1 Tax=Roseibacillus ishigakijimensis TaxID=454146 RepID=UPI0019037B9C|nr:ApaG domain [Roseibacillus ishigakijimensis]